MIAAVQPLPMRWLWAWMVVLSLTLPALGDVTGRITSIGYQSFIRPEQWVPLVVQIDAKDDTAHVYDLQVVQTDMDGDEVVYTRSGYTVNPGQQTLRTYFLPESIDGGLPASGGETAADLAKRLRVFLFDPATGKRVVRFAVAGALPQAMESGQLAANVGQKLILIVGRSPNVHEFAPGGNRLLGMAEQTFFVQVDPARLPENALPYAAVDAVVWTDADTARLAPGQVAALRQYVNGGGTLAVIQHADLARFSKLDDLLPVQPTASVDWTTPEPLKPILQPPGTAGPRDGNGHPLDPWRLVQPPFRMARGDATPDAIVDAWVDWPDGRRSPLIARRLYGTGCVAWLAEDISDPALAVVDFGWPRLWEKLFDWRDTELHLVAAEPAAAMEHLKQQFAPEVTRDLGASFVSGTNLENRTATLITLTFVFFLIYWLVAGPGSYVLLAARKRTHLSWLAYATVAAAAVVLTIVIAQVVLRGGAQVRHLSLVRVPAASDAPGRVLSHFGIYLPKDERAAIVLPHTPGGPPVGLTPLALSPHFAPESVNTRDSTYAVPVDAEADQPLTELAMPFRSTLKKLQADWTGPASGRVSGQVRLVPGEVPIEGQIVNDTPDDLTDVLIVFRATSRLRGDTVIAMPVWKKGLTLDLPSLWKKAETKPTALPSGLSGLRLFGDDKIIRGSWDSAVIGLYEDLRRDLRSDPNWDDSGKSNYRSFPLVSLFGRCPMMTNFNADATRVDLLRSGVRQWDISAAVAAGGMVVLGKATGPLPMPLTVDGDPPRGDGRLFYQAVLPVDRSAFNGPDARLAPKTEDD